MNSPAVPLQFPLLPASNFCQQRFVPTGRITHARHNALHIATITVTDPISGNDVEVGIYRELASGALFGIDGSYLEQRIDTDPAIVSSVFGNGHVLLID